VDWFVRLAWWLSLAASVVSLIGIPVIARQLEEIGREQSRARRFIPIKPKGDVHVIVTTSASADNPRGKSRGLAGKGALRGIERAAYFFTKHFPERRLVIKLSQDVEHAPSGDIIMIGGPAKNIWAQRFIDRIPSRYREFGPFRTDRDDRFVELYGVRYPDGAVPVDGLVPDAMFINEETNEPIYDYAVIISCGNPFTSVGRCLLIYGFSSEGTARAAEWFFDEIWGTEQCEHFIRRRAAKDADGFVMVACLRSDNTPRDIYLDQVAFREFR
jgi:hypothetical protein